MLTCARTDTWEAPGSRTPSSPVSWGWRMAPQEALGVVSGPRAPGCPGLGAAGQRGARETLSGERSEGQQGSGQNLTL